MDIEEHRRYRDQVDKDIEEAYKYAAQSYVRLEHIGTDEAKIGQAVIEELRGAAYMLKRLESRVSETNDLLRELTASIRSGR